MASAKQQPEVESPLYSAEMSEIMGSPPRWLLRAGSGLLLTFLLVALGASSVVRIPEQRLFPVHLHSSIPSFYVVQGAEAVRFLVPPGQVVRRGQPLTLHAIDTTLAAFTGTLFYEPEVVAAPHDTLGVLVPLKSEYRVSGRLPFDWLPHVRQHPHLILSVPQTGGGELALRATVRYVQPSVRQGQVSYVAQLDSSSSAAVQDQFGGITNLDGTVLLSRRVQPVLRRIFTN